MSPSTRPRVPHVFALIQLILRVGAFGTAVAELAVLAKLASKYSYANNHQGKTFGGAITASVIAILVNLFESISLADPKHTIKRPATCAIGTADLVTLGVGLYSVFEIALSDLNFDDAPSGTTVPWASLQYVALALMAAIVAEAAAALLLDCVSGCQEIRASKRESPSSVKMRRPKPPG